MSKIANKNLHLSSIPMQKSKEREREGGENGKIGRAGHASHFFRRVPRSVYCDEREGLFVITIIFILCMEIVIFALLKAMIK